MGSQLMQNRARTLIEYSSVSLSANAQVQSTQVISTLADVTGIDVDLSVTAAGTLSGAQTVEKAIQRLVISDRNGKPVLDLAGSDLPFVSLILSANGSYSTPETSTASTAKVYRDVIGVTAVLADQPLYLQVTFAPYTALATSGCTGATIDLAIRIWYGSNLSNQTLRVYKRTVSVVSGENHEGVNLVNGVNTQIMGFTIGTESNLSGITFSSNGNVDDYSGMPAQQLIDLENDVYRDGHQTGKFNLFVTPFVVNTQNTRLTFSASGSDTVSIYQIANN